MNAKVHSILLVEDDADTRQHFARAIEGSPRLELRAAVGSCAEARRCLAEPPLPAVVLTDLGLPDGHGIDLIREIRQSQPEVQILVISVFGDERSVIASVEAGASGYLLKDGTADQIADSLLELIGGGSPISPTIARHILRLVQAGAPTPAPSAPKGATPERSAPTLSSREIEVLQLLAKGFSSAEIAQLLALSVHTVIAHCRNIHRKLEVTSRSSAIFEAVQLGLIRIQE
jgi:DNA-binding NarL/FixJ family response regulator